MSVFAASLVIAQGGFPFFLGGGAGDLSDYFRSVTRLPVITLDDALVGYGPFSTELVGNPAVLTFTPAQTKWFRVTAGEKICVVTPTLYPPKLIHPGSYDGPAIKAGGPAGGSQRTILYFFDSDPDIRSKVPPVFIPSGLNFGLREVVDTAPENLKFDYSPAFEDCRFRCSGNIPASELISSLEALLGARAEKRNGRTRLSISPAVFRRRLLETLKYRTLYGSRTTIKDTLRYEAAQAISDELLVELWEDPKKFAEIPMRFNKERIAQLQKRLAEVMKTVDPEVREKLGTMDPEKPMSLGLGFRLNTSVKVSMSDGRFLYF